MDANAMKTAEIAIIVALVIAMLLAILFMMGWLG